MKKQNNRPSQDEPTTAIHAESTESEGLTQEEALVWAVEAAIKRGVPIEEACRQHGFTVAEWEELYEEMKYRPEEYNKADSGAVNSDYANNSRYFKNQGAAAVVREDFSGKRYIKTSDDIHERPVSKECKEAWGIPSFGTFNELLPISKEDYDSFGVYWYWSDKTGEIVYRKEYDSYISRQR